MDPISSSSAAEKWTAAGLAYRMKGKSELKSLAGLLLRCYCCWSARSASVMLSDGCDRTDLPTTAYGYTR